MNIFWKTMSYMIQNKWHHLDWNSLNCTMNSSKPFLSPAQYVNQRKQAVIYLASSRFCACICFWKTQQDTHTYDSASKQETPRTASTGRINTGKVINWHCGAQTCRERERERERESSSIGHLSPSPTVISIEMSRHWDTQKITVERNSLC